MSVPDTLAVVIACSPAEGRTDEVKLRVVSDIDKVIATMAAEGLIAPGIGWSVAAAVQSVPR